MKWRALAALAGLAVLSMSGGCRRVPETLSFDRLMAEFVYQTLAFSPVSATAAGYHRHDGTPLDGLLDDVSEAAMRRQREYYQSVLKALGRFSLAKLDAEQQADYALLDAQIRLALLELDSIRNYKRNPTYYVELFGNAIFTPMVVEYAPKEERFRHIISRLEQAGVFFEQAKRNLEASPEVWTQTAIEENEGTLRLINETLPREVPASLRSEFERSAAKARAALQGFGRFLREDLAGRQTDWRLGQELYAKKFRLTLGSEREPAEVLAEAESQITAIRRQMFELALPLHHKFYPTHRCPVDVNIIVGETLAKIAEKRATPQTYFASAERDLEETTQFVRKKNLVPLGSTGNLRVIETPEFMRGIYSVGGFNPAPPLHPELGAFYWLTPIPPGWPKERVDSKLREYNLYGLKLLTIHEAMPGHYVQFEYANRVQPEARRLLRAIYGNGAYIEGWAVYATEMMLDEGYLENNPELRLVFLKQMLRALANAVLDIRLHTMNLADAEAMNLMVGKTFQEKEEAEGKLKRAKLSSCQLPTYYVGYAEWRRLRGLYHHVKGDKFRLEDFHRDALSHGALPLAALARLITGQELGKAQTIGVK